MNNILMKLGLLLIGIATIGYFVVLIDSAMQETAFGWIILLFIGGSLLCLLQAIKDRLANKEDDYYSKNVNQ